MEKTVNENLVAVYKEIVNKAAETKAPMVMIHVRPKVNSSIYIYQTHEEFTSLGEFQDENGQNLCAAIYQGLTDVCDPIFITSNAQEGEINCRQKLPSNVVKIKIQTNPDIDGYQMFLLLQYEYEGIEFDINSMKNSIIQSNDYLISRIEDIDTPFSF